MDAHIISIAKESLDLVSRFLENSDELRTESNIKKKIIDKPFLRSLEELTNAVDSIHLENKKALDRLAKRLDKINNEIAQSLPFIVGKGVDTKIYKRIIRRVGILVPQRMPATAYTYLSAAKAAGVSELVVYLAQDEEGQLDPLSVYSAQIYGATVLGGPARLGFPSLAFGVEGIQKCHLICGPCGSRLNILKHITCLIAGVAIDMGAGPSNLAVVADSSASFRQIELDLLSQLEHGPDSCAFLILVGKTAKINWLLYFSNKILNDRIEVIYVENIKAAAQYINELGPETVEMHVQNREGLLPLLESCGVIYINGTSSLGDYGAIGRGCCDPTGGLSKGQSGLTPFTFFRFMPIVDNSEAKKKDREAAILLASYEGLAAHRNAIRNV